MRRERQAVADRVGFMRIERDRSRMTGSVDQAKFDSR
jgi:hypothetical protein